MQRKDGTTWVAIDVTDWGEEFREHEPALLHEGDVVSLVMDHGFTTSQVARMAIFSRAADIAGDDVLKPDKLLLYNGAVSNVTQKIARLKREVEMPSGRSYFVREAIGKPGRKPSDDGDNGAELNKDAIEAMGDRSFVLVDSQQALERACHYLLNSVPGHIFERFKVVVVAGGDVEDIAAKLHAEIDRMVERLIEPEPTG